MKKSKEFHLLAFSRSMQIDFILTEKKLYTQLLKIRRLHHSLQKDNKKEGELKVIIKKHGELHSIANVANVPNQNRNFLHKTENYYICT